MISKILSGMMVLLLASGCFSLRTQSQEKREIVPITIAESTPAESIPAESTPAESPPPSSPLELEETPSPQPTPPTLIISTLPPQPPSKIPSTLRFEPPISDEPSDDFYLEVLPRDKTKEGPEFDIPIVINEKVEHFIQYFQTTARNKFSNWLARSEKYIPFMKNLLKENGLPEDLVYMSLIESGFNPYAYSRSKASGPWQFIYLTGKKYGLKVNWWVDERRDPEKSTIAAAKYLKDLYDMFECWYLAAAGYNAGENKIANAMKRYRTEDFWELTKYRYLKKETKDYVPQMIAAALIAKDPEKYGFTNIEYEEPLQYEKVKVPGLTPLSLISKACEVSLEEIKDLNPELRRGVTPPEESDYEIKIPYGSKEKFIKNFETLQPLAKFQFKTHTVKKGETLPKIARLYRVEVEPIVEINRLDGSSRIHRGMTLLIPLSKDEEVKPPVVAQKKRNGNNLQRNSEEIIYTIKKGDTLWSIANEMGVNIGALSRWNNLHPDQKIVPGDKLKIRMSASAETPPRGKGEKEIIYTVKKGDSLWSIAQRYQVSVSEIRTWNHLDGSDVIYPEDKLKIRVKGSKSSTPN